MKTMVIRHLQKNNLPELLALYEHLHVSDAEMPSHTTAKNVWCELLGSEYFTYYGVFVNENLVSSCTLSVIPNLTRACSPYGLIENVVTHADHRRKGYATSLLHAAVDSAWSAGCYKVMLLSGRKDAETLRFYERAGFEPHAKQGFVLSRPATE